MFRRSSNKRIAVASCIYTCACVLFFIYLKYFKTKIIIDALLFMIIYKIRDTSLKHEIIFCLGFLRNLRFINGRKRYYRMLVRGVYLSKI